MEDRFNPVSEGELVDDLLLALLEVHLPRVLAVRLRQLYEAVVLLLAEVVEEVLVEARVLHVVGGDLRRRRGWLESDDANSTKFGKSTVPLQVA